MNLKYTEVNSHKGNSHQILIEMHKFVKEVDNKIVAFLQRSIGLYIYLSWIAVIYK